jgi:hypothetical protein
MAEGSGDLFVADRWHGEGRGSLREGCNELIELG